MLIKPFEIKDILLRHIQVDFIRKSMINFEWQKINSTVIPWASEYLILSRIRNLPKYGCKAVPLECFNDTLIEECRTIAQNRLPFSSFRRIYCQNFPDESPNLGNDTQNAGKICLWIQQGLTLILSKIPFSHTLFFSVWGKQIVNSLLVAHGNFTIFIRYDVLAYSWVRIALSTLFWRFILSLLYSCFWTKRL